MLFDDHFGSVDIFSSCGGLVYIFHVLIYASPSASYYSVSVPGKRIKDPKPFLNAFGKFS